MPLPHHHTGEFAQYHVRESYNAQALEDILTLPFHLQTGQHMSFERAPPIAFMYPRGASLLQARLPFGKDRDKSETGSVYCDVEDCDEKCGDECEEDCDDSCSVVKCSGNCNLNDLDDDCEDCIRFKAETCKEKDCVVKGCPGCKPCNEVCIGTKEADCTSPHGRVCYSPNCDIPPPQQCSFSSCFPAVTHPESYLAGSMQDVIPLNHDFSIGYDLPHHHLQFALPTIEDQYSIQDRPRKRRREDTPQIVQASNHTTPSTNPSIVFDQDHLSHSHLASPILDDQYNYLCHWGDSCQMGFMDYYALDDHVLQAHIRSQSGFACQWAACDEAEKDLDQLVDHVKTSHTSNSSQGNGHVCLWQGCNATFTNSEDLSHHLTTVHLQSPIGGMLCQWEACGVQADGPDGLTTHLHRDHFVPAASEQAGFSPSEKSPSAPPSEQEMVCQWCEEEGGETCGRQFTTTDNLQQHVKDDHIAALKKKTGYFCLWAGCTRRDKQFSQKGKVRL